MTRRPVRIASALTIVLGALLVASAVRADDVSPVLPTSLPPAAVEPALTPDTVRTPTERTGPELRATAGGLFTFGISYGFAVGVAATSGHQGDSHLYVPIVGPWLDLGDRGHCPQAASCGNETAYGALIVADGVLQTIGALFVVGSFVFPTTRNDTTMTATATTAPTVQITPVEYAHGGLGLAAVGRF
jgi:hypothetical protein